MLHHTIQANLQAMELAAFPANPESLCRAGNQAIRIRTRRASVSKSDGSCFRRLSGSCSSGSFYKSWTIDALSRQRHRF